MNETVKAILATITIVAVLTLIGVLAYLRVEGAPFAAVSAVGVIIAWLTQSPPKGPPSAANAIPLLVAGVLVAALVACGSPESKSVQADTAYTTDLANCTRESKTLDESILCEKKVDAKWGITTKETKR